MVSLILFTIFWLPIIIVNLNNTSWDLKFWQNIDHKLENLIDHFRFGWEPGHRSPRLLAAKFIAFALVSIFIIDNTSLVPILGIILAYGLWTNQALDIVAYRIRHGSKKLIQDGRTRANFAISTFLAAILPFIITVGILNLRSGNSFFEKLGGWLPNYSAQGFSLAPDIYLYLVATIFVMLVIDLCSPLITTIAVLLTSPFSYILNQEIIADAKQMLDQKEGLVKILIVGTSGKSTVRELVAHLASSQYNVVQNKYAFCNELTLAKTIKAELRSSTEIIISEVQITNPQDLKRISRLMSPQIVICTGFSSLETEYWGTYQQILTSYRELFSQIPQNGRLIINKDSEIAAEILSGLNIPTIYCTADDNAMAYHQNAVDYYHMDYELKDKEIELKIHTYNFDIPVMLPIYYKDYLYSTLLSIATANELGIPYADSIHVLSFFPVLHQDFSEIKGDNETLIHYRPGKPRLQTLENICQVIPDDSTGNILIISGIRELNSSNFLDKGLITKLQQNFHTVITTDSKLAKLISQDNVSLEVRKVSTGTQAIYIAREKLMPGNHIAILGNWEPKVLNSLKADN